MMSIARACGGTSIRHYQKRVTFVIPGHILETRHPQVAARLYFRAAEFEWVLPEAKPIDRSPSGAILAECQKPIRVVNALSKVWKSVACLILSRSLRPAASGAGPGTGGASG